MNNKVLVEVSARHVHITKEALNILFGLEELTVKKYLSQTGEFASEQRVDIVGPKNTLKNVMVLGPCRKSNQVELSATDTRTIGVPAIIRESGDIAGSAPCKIVGPKGELELKEGVIVAKRHIHLSKEAADEMSLENREIVSVLINTEHRSLIFKDVVIRVNDNFTPAMHIDTDEGNAAGITQETYGEVIKG